MTATVHTLHPRRVLLAGLVRRQGGVWRRARVERAYLAAGYRAPKHSTHRADLAALCRAGVLQGHGPADDRWYTPVPPCHCGEPIPADRAAYCSDRCRNQDRHQDRYDTEDAA